MRHPIRTRLAGFVLLVALLPALGPSARAQDAATSEEASPSASPAKPYGMRAFTADSRYLVTRPAHMGKKGWVKVAVVLGVGAGLFAYREDIRNYAQEHRTPSRDRFLSNVRDVFGRPAFPAALALSAWAASYATRDDREKETAQLLLESLGYSAVVAGIGQLVIASERPWQGDEVHFFRSHGHGVSGDAAVAASIVAPIRRQYLRLRPEDGVGRRILKVTGTGLLYAGAVLTAWQRINSDAHWVEQAYLGLADGLSVGGVLCDAHELRRGSRASLSFGAAPGGGVAVLLRLETLPGGSSAYLPPPSGTSVAP